MNRNEIIELQKRLGVEPDGFWGPKSIAACQKHLRSLMPKKSPWPKATQVELKKFYGDPGKSEVVMRLAQIDVAGIGIKMGNKDITRISVHELCAESLLRCLKKVAALPDSDGRWVLREYAGVYNHRPMRGGTNWSLHAYGAAVDLAPATNGLHTHWPTRSNMPLDVMDCFAEEGWLPAGAFWSRDAMHFQATQ